MKVLNKSSFHLIIWKEKKSIIHVTVKGLFQILFLYNFLFLQNEADAALNYIRAKSNPISKPLA